MNKRLSIIIPYYDTYEYTIKLLKELEIQYKPEVEIILVDDGCNETRFDSFTFATIVHLDKNYGACHAWNTGLDMARGEYVGFIDSDDMISMHYIDSLLDAINKYTEDEIIFDWINEDTNMHFHRPTNRSIWKAIYRSNICPRFDEELKCKTDKDFQIKLSNIPHTQKYLNKTLYYYRSYRRGSITWKMCRGELPIKKF